MKLRNSYKKRLLPVAAASAVTLAGASAFAADCPTDVPNPIYGSGGSAVTETLRGIASKLVDPALVPNEADRVTIFYADPSACTALSYFTNGTSTKRSFKYWDKDGVQSTCEAPESNIQFSHMGNTPALCPAGLNELPPGFAKFIAPVNITTIITAKTSTESSISAAALYHIFGFGAGASGKTVAPWDSLASTSGRSATSFVHQLLANAINVPATKFKLGVVRSTNDEVAADVGTFANPNAALGYVSGSTAEKFGTVKQLAYQHYDQECGYLPDSSPTKRDRLNVRTGQYYLSTPAWLYAKVDESGAPSDPAVAKLIDWITGKSLGPNDLDVQKVVIERGDVPLCALHAIRPYGDLSEFQSYLPEKPCNGYFETISAGSTDYVACETDNECTGESEKCIKTAGIGFCEYVYVAP